MAYEVVESKSFSGAKGFWKAEKGAELEGIFIKVALPKKSNGFLVFELVKDCEATSQNEKTKEPEKVTLKKGERIGVNYYEQLDSVLDYAGYQCKLVFKGKKKIGQGRTVAEFEFGVDRQAGKKRNVPEVTDNDRKALKNRSMSNGKGDDAVPF